MAIKCVEEEEGRKEKKNGTNRMQICKIIWWLQGARFCTPAEAYMEGKCLTELHI